MKVRKKSIKTPIGKIKSLCLALFNSNVKGKKKLAVIGIILYIISPIDLIPDFVPLAGYADDILLPILFLVVERILNDGAEKGNFSTMKEAEKV
ncbi:YkvA family protein [Desemzia sp. FAM 23991]|uniref:YkvA family protein n=1 Tax=unclassified Desemzia TaxID=2685243 RepID=UPI00388A132C